MTDPDESGRRADEPVPGSGVPADEPSAFLTRDRLQARGGTPTDGVVADEPTVGLVPSPESAIVSDGDALVAEGDEPTAPMDRRFGGPAVDPASGVERADALPVPPEVSPGAVGSDVAPGEMSATSPDLSISGTVSAPPAKSDLGRPVLRRPAPAGTLIWVLLALLGFTLVVQLRSNDADAGLSAMRQEDLVRILSDLEAQDSRLLAEIQALEQSKQQLTSGVAGKEAALEEAQRRSQELGLLAGTVPGRGPGLDVTLRDARASDVLNTVQELRGAGGEVMQLNGANGAAVRVVASSFFVDASGGAIIADGEQLTGPFRLLVIGPPGTMSTALQIPGGVVASVKNDGGSVTMDSRSMVEVTAVRKAAALRYARPVS